MSIVKFINSDNTYDINVSKIGTNQIRLTFIDTSNLPNENIILSGFDILNENNNEIMTSYRDYTYKYRDIDTLGVYELDNNNIAYTDPEPAYVPHAGEDTLILSSADKIQYDNSVSTINASNVQQALDIIGKSTQGSSIIHVTTSDPTLGGKLVTATSEDGKEVHTSIIDQATMSCDIHSCRSFGKWTISCEDITKYVDIVKYYGKYDCKLSSSFDYNNWLAAGRVSGTYANLDEVLADEKALRQLFIVHDSVDFLVQACAEELAEEVGTIINDDYCAKWINLSDYALDTLYANEFIHDAMDTADKYFYGEWALMPQVPKMTSNTAPYGEVFASNAESSYPAWKAFDGDAGTWWAATHASSIGYDFLKAVRISKVQITNAPTSSQIDNGNLVVSFKLQGRNNTTDEWVDNSDTLTIINLTRGAVSNFNITSNTAYRYHRIQVVTNNGGSYDVLASIQFYAWAPKGNVPVMTSNTAPYGEASGNSGTSTYPAYYAFDDGETAWSNGQQTTGWLQYKFVTPTRMMRIYLRPVFATGSNDGLRLKTYTVQGSNNGSSWIDLFTETVENDQTLANGFYRNIENDQYYFYYRISVNGSYEPEQRFVNLKKVQFYGRELKISVPVMTSNAEPYGEAILSGIGDTENKIPYKAFDNNTSTFCHPGNYLEEGSYVGYRFTGKTVIKMVMIKPRYTTGSFVKNFNVIVSNDSINFETIYSGHHENNDDATYYSFNNSVDSLICAVARDGASYAGDGSLQLSEMQFYGLDYSEKEFEQGTNKKWLYDHGVELDTFIAINSNVQRRMDDLYGSVSASRNIAYFYTPPFDITPYSKQFVRISKEAVNGSNSRFAWNEIATNVIDNFTIIASVNVSTPLAHLLSCVDVSNVNQSYQSAIGIGSDNTGAKWSFSEWWLE